MPVIDSKKIDPYFKFEIAKTPGGEGILKCYACGACTARCPEREVDVAWNPRVVIRKALLGLREEVYESMFVWVCSAHYRCLEKCPQEVNVKELMNAVRSVRLLEESKDDQKKLSSLDSTLKYLVVDDEQGKGLYECFSCGTCTAGCPERELDNLYSPRRVIRAVMLGHKDAVFENRFVDICSTHYRCLTQCPQGVEIPKLMSAIRVLAERDGFSRPEVKS